MNDASMLGSSGSYLNWRSESIELSGGSPLQQEGGLLSLEEHLDGEEGGKKSAQMDDVTTEDNEEHLEALLKASSTICKRKGL